MTSLAFVLVALLQAKVQVKDPAPELPAMAEQFRSSSRPFFSIDFHPTEAKIALGCDGGAMLIDLETKKPTLEMKQLGIVNAVLFHREGKLLVTRSEGPDAMLRPLPAGDPIPFQITHSPGYVTDGGLMKSRHGSPTIIFAPEKKTIIMADGSRGVRLWTLDGLANKTSTVSEIAFDFIDTRVLTQKEKDAGKLVPAITIGRVTALAMDGYVLWIGMEDGYLLPVPNALVNERISNIRIRTEEEQQQKNGAGAATPIPSTLTMPTPDAKSMQGRSFHSCAAAKVWRPHAGDINAVGLYSPSSDILARSGLVPPADAPMPDDLRLITAGADGHVRVWKDVGPVLVPPDLNRNNGPKALDLKPDADLKGHTFAISPDRKHIAIAEADGVRIYSFPKFKPEFWTPVDRKLGRPIRLDFNSDGTRLAALMCACGDCAGSKSEKLQLTPKVGRPDHGGALVVWELVEAKKDDKK